MSSQAGDALRRDLSGDLAMLPPGGHVTVVEPAAAGAAAFRIERDGRGAARVRRSEFAAERDVSGAAVRIAVPAGEEPAAAELVRRITAARPDARSYVLDGEDAAALIADVAAALPIPHAYGLLVARADPADGRVRLSSEPLFPEGARRGAAAELSVRSEEENRLVFAVVTRDAEPGLLSAASAVLPAGTHRVRAELDGPGAVRFTSPAGLVPDPRTAAELTAAVPTRLDAGRPVHLVCAVEVAGPAARVAARLDCAERVALAADRDLGDRLRVGLIGYGAHRRGAADGVVVTDWRSDTGKALRSLSRFGAADLGYPRAAQVEDVLAEVLRRIGSGPGPGRTVLLVIGDRPPHPPAPDGDVVRCPRRHDWRSLLGELEVRPDVALAAVRDQPAAPGGAAWARIGGTALKPLDTVDADALAAQLGLTSPPTGGIPVPLAC